MTRIRFPVSILVLIASLTLPGANEVRCQSITTIYTFTLLSDPIAGIGTNSDGAEPFGQPYGLAPAGDVLYGSASVGGAAENGTVFAVTATPGGFTNLHSFTATPLPFGINS